METGKTAGNGKRILLVDDEPIILKMVSSRLQANGYEVLTACDGAEALERARGEGPDLIILDVMLPKLDGYRVCQLLKGDASHRHIPIVMFSARVQTDDMERGMQSGADAYLPKPFNPVVLLNKLEELLKA